MLQYKSRRTYCDVREATRAGPCPRQLFVMLGSGQGCVSLTCIPLRSVRVTAKAPDVLGVRVGTLGSKGEQPAVVVGRANKRLVARGV